MTWIDLLILAIVGSSVYSSAKSGLLFAFVDVARAIIGIVIGALAYALLLTWSHDYVAGAMAFLIAALLSFTLLGILARKLLQDTEKSKTTAARIGAGAIGFGFGLLVCLFVVPVLGNLRPLVGPVGGSPLARVFIGAMPGMNSLADALDADLPQLSRRADDFYEEGSGVPGRLSRRVNYTRLDGSTCIKCGGRVEFDGYFLTGPAMVSPRFRCPVCLRTSDGCQTYEGFHEMYGKCPIQVVVDDNVDLDCGVWPNEEPVRPTGECPVCGLTAPW